MRHEHLWSAAPLWPAPADQARYIKKANLVADQMEHFVVHFHDHLDVLVNGLPVPVPEILGIDERAKLVAELHTHDSSGIIHVESAEKNPKFTLGQLMILWNVPLSENQIGDLHTSPEYSLSAYVNGVKATGNPADISIKGGQEIALVYGPVGAQTDVPSTYKFPADY